MSKFFTFEDRLTIEKGLRENQSFGAIAKELGKDRTTISKEVKKYAYDLKSGYSKYPYNACVHRAECKAKKICGAACTKPSTYKCSVCNKGYGRTRVFYCDPSKPYEKGAIEVNHELIRRILPKGTSFNNLTQNDVLLMMNHINSYKRKKLNNRSPYEAFSFYYGEEVAKKLGCQPVAADDIILKPCLLKK